MLSPRRSPVLRTSFPATPGRLNGSTPGSNGRGTGSIPITATPDVSGGNPYLGGGGPRNIQLAVKFQF